MLYLEFQHGPSYVRVEQQTVGSYTGARVACILYRNLQGDKQNLQSFKYQTRFSSFIPTLGKSIKQGHIVC